jgi:antitoxin (DNA-binding transcriptional repressor) of toxin-antitoxin stability system
MQTVTVEQAAEKFDEYSKLAHDGERILVTREGHPWVTLSPPTTPVEPVPNGLQWPDFAARLAQYYPKPVEGPTATELLARDKEDRF